MFHYGKVEEADVESEVTHIEKHTLDRGLTDNGVLNFRIPGDSERFTDMSRIYIRVELKVRKGNGDIVSEDEVVTLDMGGIHSLFDTCSVSFNEEVVSSMTSYAYSTLLSRLLGTSQNMRGEVWSDMEGSWDLFVDKNDLSQLPPAMYHTQNKLSGALRKTQFYGRIYSDILMSCRQYLPPGVSLGIEMRRKNDAFSLIAPSGEFGVDIVSASIYVPRLRLSDTITRSITSSMVGGVANMTFNRLETRMEQIAATSHMWQWRNITQFGPLPNRLYFALVPQKAVYGTIARASTYFDSLALSSFNLKLNGRSILVEPMRMEFKYTESGEIDQDKSDAKDGYMSIINVLNAISNQIDTVRLSPTRYAMGGTIYAVELGRCGEKGGASGVLDVELTFSPGGCREEACAFVFTEKTAHIPVRTRL